MTEDEKEAIEQLKSWREFIIKNKNKVNKANDIEFYLRTALNLMQNQQKEIQCLKQAGEATEKVYKMQLEKKDKMIDLMSVAIYDYANLEALIKCPAEHEGRYNLENCKMNLLDRNCIICIKQYFERKVER